MKIWSLLMFLILVSFKSFSYGYISNVTNIKSNSSTLNLYTWTYTMSLQAKPEQTGTMDLFDQSGAFLALAVYNMKTGRFYPWIGYEGPIYDLSAATKPLSIDRAILIFWNDSGLGAQFAGWFAEPVDFENSCMELVVMLDNGDILGVVPGGNCTPLPPPDITCSTSGDLTLDHGTISAGNINNNSVSKTLQVSCSGDTRLNISLSQNEVELGDGLKSEVLINGNDMSSSLDISSATDFSLNVTSVLKESGSVSPGTYTGSTIIIVSPY